MLAAARSVACTRAGAVARALAGSAVVVLPALLGVATLVGTPGPGAVPVAPEVAGPELASPGLREGGAELSAAAAEEPLGEELVLPGAPPVLAAGLEPTRAAGEPAAAGPGPPVVVELLAGPSRLAPPAPPLAPPGLPAGPATGVLVAVGGELAPT